MDRVYVIPIGSFQFHCDNQPALMQGPYGQIFRDQLKMLYQYLQTVIKRSFNISYLDKVWCRYYGFRRLQCLYTDMQLTVYGLINCKPSTYYFSLRLYVHVTIFQNNDRSYKVNLTNCHCASNFLGVDDE